MKRYTSALLVLFIILGISANEFIQEIDSNDSLAQTLFALGEARPDHYIESPSSEAVKRGEELIKLGKTIDPKGSSSGYISKYYVCTSCHNLQREDTDLTVVDQNARLDYAMANKIPYLQGSTFWGMVNRETWYNDDYVLKYGDLVKDAEKSLKASVELCATVCSQGRSLKGWEMESIMAYLWSLEMKISDLGLSDAEMAQLNSSMSKNGKITLLKSKYLQKSPATFVDPPADQLLGYDYEGDPVLGKAIYELGCQHCHRPNGESDVILDNTALSLNWLERHITDQTQLSIYQIIRKGTYAEYGHKEYMPHYTLEKMSDQQLEHLRAFIENPEAANVN
ncbi:MAG: cytochrome c [Marinoscillum sp.]